MVRNSAVVSENKQKSRGKRSRCLIKITHNYEGVNPQYTVWLGGGYFVYFKLRPFLTRLLAMNKNVPLWIW
jgi:hypothetical protein